MVAAFIVSAWVVPAPWEDEHAWIRPALGTIMFLSWTALEGTARGETTAGVAAMFFAAGGVALYAHSQSFMNISLVMAFAFFGVAVVAGAAKVEASCDPGGGRIPSRVMLNVRYQSESQVPLVAFWLVGLAPLPLLFLLMPRLARQSRWLILLLKAMLQTASQILTEFDKLTFDWHPTDPLILKAFDIATVHRRSMYDSLYLALAEQLDGQMLTADQRLLNALAGTPLAHRVRHVTDNPP